MASAPHLIFNLHDSLYAVPARVVSEIVWLPDLTPLAQAPFYVAGVVNLRGQIVPVIDLSLRLGQGRHQYQVSDSIIVLKDDGHLVGIIVSDVRRVQSIDEEIESLSPLLLSSRKGDCENEESATRFVAGITRVDDEIVTLLYLENLLRLPEYSAPAPGQDKEPDSSLSAQRSFCPQATPEEKAIFQARAKNLRQPLAKENAAELTPLAVVGLNGEYFGIDLQLVREFSALRAVTRVPCCPLHIVGQMNLRGDILTLVDVRGALQMPPPAAANDAFDVSGDIGKVVVIQTDELRVGVMVDEVFDVMNLQPSQMRAVPSAAQSLSAEYLKGTAPYKEKMLSILDLPKLLKQDALTVHEEA